MAAHSEHTPLGAGEERGGKGRRGEDREEGKQGAAGGSTGSQTPADAWKNEDKVGGEQSGDLFVNDN